MGRPLKEVVMVRLARARANTLRARFELLRASRINFSRHLIKRRIEARVAGVVEAFTHTLDSGDIDRFKIACWLILIFTEPERCRIDYVLHQVCIVLVE